MTPIALAPRTSVAACPSCGRPVRRPRHDLAPPSARELVDPSRMSYADLCQHYHRTAPVEDLRFFLRHARLSAQLRADGDGLLAAGCRDTGGVVSRREWYRRLTALQGRWRRETAEVPSGATTDVERGAA
jgi:hypothetical protein